MRASLLALAPLYSILYLLFIFRRKTAGPSRNELKGDSKVYGIPAARDPRAQCAVHDPCVQIG